MDTPAPTAGPPAATGDLAAIAADMTPIWALPERTGSAARATASTTPTGPILDFASGIAITCWATATPRSRPRSTPRWTGPHMGPIGYIETESRTSAGPRGLPGPAQHRCSFSTPAARSIEAALKLARRVTGRPGIVVFRGGFHGRTFGDVGHQLEPELPHAGTTSRSGRGSNSSAPYP